MSSIESRLRDEAARDATAFDAALHARVMRRVGEMPTFNVAPSRRALGVGRIAGGALAAAATIAAGVWLARSPARPQTAMPGLPWQPDRSIARLYAPLDGPPLPGPRVAAGVSRFLADQFDLATSLRPSRPLAPPPPA